MHEHFYIGPGMGPFNPYDHIEGRASVLSRNRKLLAGANFMIEIRTVAVVSARVQRAVRTASSQLDFPPLIS
jgi:hypothetical protein